MLTFVFSILVPQTVPSRIWARQPYTTFTETPNDWLSYMADKRVPAPTLGMTTGDAWGAAMVRTSSRQPPQMIPRFTLPYLWRGSLHFSSLVHSIMVTRNTSPLRILLLRKATLISKG